MPAKSESQARLFRMAYLIRHGRIKDNKKYPQLKKLADSKLSDDKMREFFTTEKKKKNESLVSLSTFLTEKLNILVTPKNRSKFSAKKLGDLEVGDTIYIYTPDDDIFSLELLNIDQKHYAGDIFRNIEGLTKNSNKVNGGFYWADSDEQVSYDIDDNWIVGTNYEIVKEYVKKWKNLKSKIVKN